MEVEFAEVFGCLEVELELGRTGIRESVIGKIQDE